jgi:hypothetical protein
MAQVLIPERIKCFSVAECSLKVWMASSIAASIVALSISTLVVGS